MKGRIDRLRALLERDKLDALLVTSPVNRRYLSGFTGSAGVLLIDARRTALLSDFRYRERAAAEAPDWEFHLVKPPEMPEPKLIAQVVNEWQPRTLGFEAEDLTWARHATLSKTLSEAGITTELRPTEELVEELRVVKDANELASLERAIAITDAAFAAVRPSLRPEMRERDVAWELEKAMRDGGADSLAFPIIVAAGPNGAQPHARAGDGLLGRGQPVVMDFGALVDGYHADMTRTVILGEADEHWSRIYRIVLEAQQFAAANVRAGMRGLEGDALARDRIEQAGYGEHFGHGLGHGVGLAIHEGPSMRRAIEAPLPVGAVLSVEPGIYLPGQGGVRIEDLVVLEEDGARTLTQSSKDPVVVLE